MKTRSRTAAVLFLLGFVWVSLACSGCKTEEDVETYETGFGLEFEKRD